MMAYNVHMNNIKATTDADADVDVVYLRIMDNVFASLECQNKKCFKRNQLKLICIKECPHRQATICDSFRSWWLSGAVGGGGLWVGWLTGCVRGLPCPGLGLTLLFVCLICGCLFTIRF